MLSFCKCIYIILLTIILTLMVVLATNVPLPARKIPLAGTSPRVTYGFMQNRLSHDGQRQTEWSKEFLAKREAMPHSAPYTVSIQLMTPDQGLVHYCAGTIINEHWILTAAHCLSSRQVVENSVIVAGSHDIHATEEQEHVQMRHIDYYVVHELYLGGVNPYDIALIYTKSPLQFNKYVEAAQLPTQNEQPEGYGTLYGWGNVSMTAVPNYPHKLQEANMPILDLELCEKVLEAQGFSLHETNLCTGPLSGGVSICTADSGGPLIQECCTFFDKTYTVIGIVSWGKIPCGQKNAPSVFVRVSAFTDWINQIITTATRIE
ncbi:chymotrypsinogen A-like [Teleopsis dalmanni]|uniref:chymotrypsinogen A-like n=1 Tax=Teleopsis dalmanni TaxID=139649 RepID=UPI0018CE4564|nr:chymotrypsinogen A-like [Teleopsis dalmanni]